MLIGSKEFDFEKKTYVMGILNVTPDSFSDGNEFYNVDAALKHAMQMISEGADIIDVGGESTRPGYTQISDEEEIERVSPVIEALKKETDVPISLDTYKAGVAKAGILAGADLINDIWGLKYDENIARVIADNNKACCIMHNRDNTDYADFEQDVLNDLAESIRIAKKYGISDDKIILDPGVGFAKDTEQNLKAIALISNMRHMGYPVLLGVSRKSVIGNVLGIANKKERLYGTIALDLEGMKLGARILRVHDVKAHVDAVKMTEALLEYC